MTDLPKHVAIIMDGNGRWAKARRLPRKAIVRHTGELGIQYLTLYAFSTENWSRPEGEINDLMGLLRVFLKSETADMHKNNVRLRVIGARERLSDDIVKMIENVEGMTANNTGLNLNIALDYGGRQEILKAVNNAVKAGNTVNEETFSNMLCTADIPDPDVLIRTSGEMRISNFLLWQCAYTEFVFSDVLWPDFSTDEFDKAMVEYQNRDRRYGRVESV
jgi:undecaprenyl diphosphate synthase